MASIEKRGTNTWRLTVELGVDALGERIRERKTVKVEEPALLRSTKRLKEHLEYELAKFRMEIESGERVKVVRMTFTEYAEIWRDQHAKSQYSPRTCKNYNDRLDSHVLPYFKRMYLDEIKPLHALGFKNYLATPEARMDGKGGVLKATTQLFIFKVFTAMMNFAHEELKLIKDNPTATISPPRVSKAKKKQSNVYSYEEAVSVIEALFRLPMLWTLYFLGAMMGGFRRGELLALEWTDVDFPTRSLYIRQSISWTENGQYALKGTKEDNEEWVAMPGWYMELMREYLGVWQAEREEIPEDMWEGGPHQFVFHNGYGKPYYHDTPTATWRKFLARNHLRNIRLHDLRHTAATLLLEDGVDLKLIQERLRHAKLETTGDFYAHVTRRANSQVAERLDKFDPSRLGTLGTDWGRSASNSIRFVVSRSEE